MDVSKQELLKRVRETCKEFCRALAPDEVQRFLQYTQLIEVEPNVIIADVGTVKDTFYFVMTGAVHLYQVEDGHEVEVGSILPGGLVGEMSFFDRKPRTIRLRASDSGAELLEISRQRFNRLRIDESYIATNLLEFVIRSLDWLIRNLGEENGRLKKRLEACDCPSMSGDDSKASPTLVSLPNQPPPHQTHNAL